jgi:CHAT domain-containing protein/tetratricopeptide (TPR) repeat protein/tRNA A-37 threonylcarbamoyl transferase component Bud32
LYELILVEAELRRAAGESPTADEYRQRFPDRSEIVDAAFAVIGTVSEDTSSGKVEATDGTKHNDPLPKGIDRYPVIGQAGQGGLGTVWPQKFIASEQLLFGIIALQNNFVTREQFVASFDAWVQNKTRTLAEILEQQGALTPDQRAVLQPLVTMFLKKHGGNAEESLAALSPVPLVAPELEKLHDADILASLGHVGREARAASETETILPFQAGGFERFRILRPYAKGGLGQVSVALDQELHREVALKELLPRHADDAVSRERFLQEAEITGGLEHPGIVPVYALGQGPDGRPFYAMRFVKGDSLKRAIEEFHRADNPDRSDPGARQLALRQLLGRFIDVCNAMEYAHSRGVLHRDLKPGNIMVGKYGETLVVDWGLAKAVGKKEIASEEATLRPSSALSSSGQTQPGSAIGMPVYMSPEQAAGRLDELKPTTDVYCLGATLYHLLTGKPPFEKGDVADILAKVQRGEYPKPGTIEADTPRSLEAICLKAMALKPSDRYPTARALADDLEHWLADEPVVAAPDTMGERMSRFGRKHRGYVRTGAIAVVLVAFVSTAAALLVTKLADENAKLAESERKEKTKAQQSAKRNKVLADEKTELAESERRAKIEAERNQQRADDEREVASALNEFFTAELIGQADIRQQEMTKEPGLEAQTWKPNSNITVREVLDRADSRVGRKFAGRPLVEAAIRVSIAKTYRGVGHADKAIKNARRAFEIQRERISAEDLLAVAINLELANCLHDARQYADAEPLFVESLGICRRVVGEEHAETARCYNDLAVNLRDQGKFADAQPLFEKALDLRRDLLGEAHLDTVMSYNNLAANLHAMGQYGEAKRLFQKALDLRREFLGENHPDTASSYNNLAIDLYSRAEYADALPLFVKALDLRRELLGEKHPDTGSSLENLALNLNAQGKYYEAQRLVMQALQLWLELFGEKDLHTARGYANLASTLEGQGKYVEAQPLFEKALDLHRDLLGEMHHATAASHDALANNMKAQGWYGDAQVLFQKALDLRLATLGERHPDTARSYRNLAANLDAQQKYADAQSLFQRALDLSLQLPGGEDPVIASSYSGVADSLSSQERYADAQPLYQHARDLCVEMFGEWHPDTATSYYNLAANLYVQGNQADASPLLVRAAETYEFARLNVGRRLVDRAIFGAERSPYPLLAALHARIHAPVNAWTAAERNLGRGLTEQTEPEWTTTLTPDERARVSELNAGLDSLQAQVLRLVSIQTMTDAERDDLARVRAERTMLESRLAGLVIELSQREVATLAAVQRAMPADAALLLWVDVRDRGVNEHWGCIVRRSGEPAWESLMGTGPDGAWTKDESSLTQNLREAMASATVGAGEIQALAQRVYAQRIAPLAKHLTGVKSLYVAGVNQMAGVPVEVLTDDYTVSYVPSGTFLARLADREPAVETGLLALADPIFTDPNRESQPKSAADLPPGGLLITMVAPDGAAAKVNLKSGDVLIRYGDTALSSAEELAEAIKSQADAQATEVTISVWREGQKEPFYRSVPPGRLGVAISKEPARDAIANRRKTGIMLAELRGGAWKDLPGTRVELAQLAKLFGREIKALVDSGASEQALEELRQKGDLSKYRYLHFATHSAADLVRSFESVLILSQDALPKDPVPRPGEPFINGQLSADEVLEFWKLNADLVTLSASETALGRPGGGDGLLGFSQAFLAAGSRAVCLSLWNVDDTATVLLMTRLYQNLLGKRKGLEGPMPKAKALAEAKHWLRELSSEEALKLIASATNSVVRGERGKAGEPLVAPIQAEDFRPFRHPRFWAAFILIGDPN